MTYLDNYICHWL